MLSLSNLKINLFFTLHFILRCPNSLVAFFLFFLYWCIHNFHWLSKNRQRARFTKQAKLAQECNSKRVLLGIEISAGDLLTMCKLKNRHNISLTCRPTQYTKCSADLHSAFFVEEYVHVCIYASDIFLCLSVSSPADCV